MEAQQHLLSRRTIFAEHLIAAMRFAARDFVATSSRLAKIISRFFITYRQDAPRDQTLVIIRTTRDNACHTGRA